MTAAAITDVADPAEASEMGDSDNKGTARGTVLIENSRTRVTEWYFEQLGDSTGWHRHAYDYVVVPLFDGNLEILSPDGSRSLITIQSGVPYFRTAGVEHDVLNGNDFACSFVEIEFLETAHD